MLPRFHKQARTIREHPRRRQLRVREKFFSRDGLTARGTHDTTSRIV
jgi:hypothetical protein